VWQARNCTRTDKFLQLLGERLQTILEMVRHSNVAKNRGTERRFVEVLELHSPSFHTKIDISNVTCKKFSWVATEYFSP